MVHSASVRYRFHCCSGPRSVLCLHRRCQGAECVHLVCVGDILFHIVFDCFGGCALTEEGGILMEFMVKLICACGASQVLEIELGLDSLGTERAAVVEAVGAGWDVREAEDGYVFMCPKCCPVESDVG